jgi:hypothetical protein
MDKTADRLFTTGRASASRPSAADGEARDDSRPPNHARSLLSSSLVGSTNRGRVLQALFDLGPTSRVELARQAGVNRTTISGIVQPLLDQRLLVEGKPVPPRRRGSGKPARPLWFSPNAQPICGVLLMPGSIRAALVTLEGKIIAEHEETLPTAADRRSEVIDLMAACITRTLAASSDTPSSRSTASFVAADAAAAGIRSQPWAG